MSDYALSRDVWEVRADDWPSDAPIASRAAFLLRYAILAPSSHNSQPWLFRVNNASVEVHADERNWLREADPDRRELYLSVGCAVENLIVAAQHFDLTPALEFTSDEGGPVVVVDLQSSGSTERRRPRNLFRAIPERRTSHAHFYERAPDDSIFETFKELVYASDLGLHIITSSSARQTLAEMQADADQAQMKDEEYRRELGEWIGAGALGDSWPKARISQFVVTHFDIGKSEGANNASFIREAPAVALITARDDSSRSRLHAGQLYERLALAAAAEGIATHPLSQMLEVDEHRHALGEVFDADTQVAQHFFRMGFARSSRRPTPRWPLERFLLPG